jgi:hypothetical protein
MFLLQLQLRLPLLKRSKLSDYKNNFNFATLPEIDQEGFFFSN